MKTFKHIKHLIVFTLISTVSFIACSDDSTSPELDEPPELPTAIIPANVDNSYFANQDVPNDEEHSVYNQVKSTALMGVSTTQAGGIVNLASSFIQLAPLMNVEPEKVDGSWVWTFTDLPFNGNFKGITESDFTFNNDEEELVLKIIATPTNGGINWEIRFTGLLDGENFVEDFRLITGFTSSDETTGEWNFFLPESGTTPVFNYVYEMQSETEFVVEFIISFEGQSATIEYEKNGVENWMTFSDGTETASVYWNENTNSGWIEADGNRQCYTNFENSSCS